MKRIGIILLSAVAVTTLQGGVFAAESVRDLPTNWSKPAVEKALEKGLLTTYEGNVFPERALTRAEMAAIINRTFKATTEASLSGYSDVEQSRWYYSDIAKSLQMQAFTGSQGKMNPERAITREEAFSVLARVFEMQHEDTSVLNQFTDGSSVSSWARESVAAMVKAGYVSGSEGRILPAKTITRAEFAQVMNNLANTIVGQSTVEVPNIIEGNLVVSIADTIIRNTTVSGDMILADGIGSGDVTLENVKVSGRLIVRGGGSGTVKLVGSSIGGEVVVHNINHTVRILSDASADISQLRVRSNLILEANVAELTLTAPVKVEQRNGMVTSAVVAGSAAGAQINMGTGAAMGTLRIEGENVTVSGSGRLQNVSVGANNAGISVPGAVVNVANSVTGATVGNVPVSGGNTAIVGQKGSSSSGSNSGNSGGIENGGAGELTKTSGDWVGISQTGIVDVDFLKYVALSLNLEAMEADKGFDVYTYYLNGVEKKIGKEVSQVVSLPTQNRMIVKILMDNNASSQELKLIKGKEYMTITLGEIGSSIKN